MTERGKSRSNLNANKLLNFCWRRRRQNLVGRSKQYHQRSHVLRSAWRRTSVERRVRVLLLSHGE